MIPRLLAIVLCCLAVAARAQPVQVISGEHAGFSRLVVMFDTPNDWEFGRVPGGYELRTDAILAELVGRQIFSFIPRTRIESVSFPAPGRMFLAVTCNCTGDVFDIRRGRLAIDIKDGGPGRDARFEATLSPLADGLTWQRDPGPADALWVVAPDGGTAPTPAGRNQRIPDGLETPRATAVAKGDSGPHSKVSTASGSHRTPPQTRRRGGPDPGQLSNVSDPPASVPTGPILASWPADWNRVLSDIDAPRSARVKLTETALLQQLSRAAAQGLLQVDLPEIVGILPSGARPEDGIPRAQATQEDTALAAKTEPPKPADHLRVETVVDRDAVASRIEVPRADLGLDCLAEDLFQVADWGPGDVRAAPLSGLRAKICSNLISRIRKLFTNWHNATSFMVLVPKP